MIGAQEPSYWKQRELMSWVLWPFTLLYHFVSKWRQRRITPHRVAAPVICIGNNRVGGAGKTPTAMAIAGWMREAGFNPAFISRGFGGSYQGVVKVEPGLHSALEVGDEPLLLARIAPCYVARRRFEAANRAIADGADLIIMDDGLQNPSLIKDATLMVVDGPSGFGNGFMIPAGPCREPIADSIKKADAIIVMGEPNKDVAKWVAKSDKPVFYATVAPRDSASLKGLRCIAFSGIAHPEKFFSMLEQYGVELVQRRSYADHHAYTLRDMEWLRRDAREDHAQLVTTEKDYVRLEDGFKSEVLPIAITWQCERHLELRERLLEWVRR